MTEDKTPTVVDLLDKVAYEICRHYCKYLEQFENDEEKLNEHCEKCPFDILGI